MAATANENCGFLDSVVSDDVSAWVGRLRLVMLFWFVDFQGEFNDCVLKKRNKLSHKTPKNARERKKIRK